MKTDSILNELAMMMGDRFNDALNKSEEYQQAIATENGLYEQLKKVLPEQHHELLEQYTEASSETADICEAIAYRQGLRDIIRILFDDEES